MRPRLSIGKKLVLIVAVVAVPLVTVLGLSYFRWYQVRLETLMAERVNIAHLTASTFSTFVREVQRTGVSDGEAIVRNNYSRVQVERVLRALLRDYPVASAVWTDPEGVVSVATDPRMVDRSLGGNPAYRDLVLGDDMRGLGDLEQIGGTNGFWVTRAVAGRPEQPGGIVGVFVSATLLRDYLPIRSVSGGQNLLDTKGRVVLQTEYEGLAIGQDWSGYPFVRAALGGETGKNSGFRYPGIGASTLIAAVPVGELGWAAGSSVSDTVELNALRRTLGLSILATIGILLAGLAVSVGMGRSIVSSLRYVQRRAREVGAGDFDHAIHVGTQDEVADLAHSLDETRQKLKRTVEGLADLAETGRRLSSSLEFDRVRQVTARSARRLFGAVSTWVLTPDPRAGDLRVLFASGAAAEAFLEVRLPAGAGMGGRVFVSGIREVIPDLGAESVFVASAAAAEAGLAQSVLMPLMVGERVSGVLGLAWLRTEPAALDSRELELIETFASQVSIALENAQLYEERRQASELGDVLNDLNATLNATPEFSSTLPEVMDRAFRGLRCEVGAFYLVEGDEWVVGPVRGRLGAREGERMPRRSSLQSLLASGRRSVVVDDTQDAGSYPWAEVIPPGLRSFVATPLRFREDVVGLLLFGHRSAPVPFAQAEVDFVDKLAASMSLAMENSRLYEVERHIADTLQEALLMVPEGVSGCEYGTLYRSATELSRVGGDFFDLFEIGQGRVAVLIGDVSGKGLEAASLTSLVKNAVRIFAHEGLSTGEVLQRTNQFLTRHVQGPSFVTAFLAVVDPATGELRYSSAGHPPALVRDPSGEVTSLRVGSTVLGVFADEGYREEREQVSPEHLVLLYTDGAIEARDGAGRLLGEAGLSRMLADLRASPTAELPERLFERIMEFSGGRLGDDLAMVAFALRPPAD